LGGRKSDNLTLGACQDWKCGGKVAPEIIAAKQSHFQRVFAKTGSRLCQQTANSAATPLHTLNKQPVLVPHHFQQAAIF